ncbi:hypothetical protein MTR_5g097640 [Medicago truncatula]|uniref:Uncharacterized protein n=1 Tax=Medicago truncatula TaxID=3880 RepID=G7K4W7_MEDTR|nr:hypothetical protein MTR_5g097640 [Medicago truncatula]
MYDCDICPNKCGANVNVRLFRGYATTTTVREGHLKILQVFINSGVSQLLSDRGFNVIIDVTYLAEAILSLLNK